MVESNPPEVRMPGVEFVPGGPLIDSLMARLRDGPCTAQDLAADVLATRGGPPGVADRLISELIGEMPGIVCERGRWQLAAADSAIAGSPALPIAGPTDRSPTGRPANDTPPDIPIKQLGYAVVDVETTGLSLQQGGRIIEIAIVHVDEGVVVRRYSTLLNAGVPVSAFIRRLTGIDSRMIGRAPEFSDVRHDIEAWLRGRVFVAHNMPYDWGFVCEEMRRAGAVVPRGPRLCTLQMARRVLPQLDSVGLDGLAHYYGIEITARHRAEGDAVATAQALAHMLDESERRGWTTWSRLREELGHV